MKKTFREYLKEENLSENTITAYVWTAEYFISHYDALTKENLLAYKEYLMEFFEPATVNLRLLAINKYLSYQDKEYLRLRTVKLSKKNYFEHVISNADYLFLKNQLKESGCMTWYFIIWYMAATGARISELVCFKVENIRLGYLDLYGKGGKIRRIYIPKRLREETEEWLSSEQRDSGYLFLNHFGEPMTTGAISKQLKRLAARYHLDSSVMYPHSFRHLYAKNFLEQYNDVSFLADLMGHESVETTRIYLRRTAVEQQELVDKIVVW